MAIDPTRPHREVRIRREMKTMDQTEEAPTVALRPVAADTRRVLVVDDSASMRRAIQLRLEAMGHRVTLAESGEEAFARCTQATFDLVVSDVTMGAVSGVHLCRMLRAEPTTREVAIVLLTADDGPRSKFWGRHAGCDAYVSKREPDTLAQAVKQALQARPGTTKPQPGARPIDPLERLSRVLDRHLLQAVVASEVRALMEHVGDRARLFEAALDLFDDVLACPYALLELESRGGSRRGTALLVRGALSTEPEAHEKIALGMKPDQVVDAIRRSDAVGPPEPGDVLVQPVLAGREVVGRLRLYGGPRGLGSDDAETALWLAAALGPVLKSLLLVEETQRLATTDPLTGLNNRRTIEAALQLEVHRATRYGSPVSVVLCDVDRFKSINDTWGHPTGDEVLCAIARTLQGSLREVDVVGRWGGEEFLIVLPQTDADGAMIVAERLCAAIRSIAPFKNGPTSVTTSAGVATFRLGVTRDAFLRQADAALYDAKRSGRDRVCLAA